MERAAHLRANEVAPLSRRTDARILDASPLERILVRLPNWLGDVVMAAPSVAALAEASPRAEVVAASRPQFAPLAARLPGVARVLPLPHRRGLGALRRDADAVRAERCDAAVVFPRSTRAALPTALARVPVRVGFSSEGRSPWLTHPVRGWRRLRLEHRSEYYAALLGPFGLAPKGPWRLVPPDDALRWADEFLAAAPGRRAGRPVVAFEAGASYGPAKRWPVERFAAVARDLVSSGAADVVVIGTEDARPVEDEVAARSGQPVLRATGRTDLLRLAALLSRSAALLSNDTGPMHLASAVGTPVVALFGATDPRISGPRGGPSRVLYEKVPCSPCFLRHCPVPGHPCLAGLSVERVREAVLEALADPRGAGTFAPSPSLPPERTP
jgi:heptosyltransferase-2